MPPPLQAEACFGARCAAQPVCALQALQHLDLFARKLGHYPQFAALDEILGMGVAFRLMPYEFTDHEYEPEAQASSSRAGVPPRKITGVGVLDPPVPPRKLPGPLTPIPASLLKRIFAVIILIGVAIVVAMLLMHR